MSLISTYAHNRDGVSRTSNLISNIVFSHAAARTIAVASAVDWNVRRVSRVSAILRAHDSRLCHLNEEPYRADRRAEFERSRLRLAPTRIEAIRDTLSARRFPKLRRTASAIPKLTCPSATSATTMAVMRARHLRFIVYERSCGRNSLHHRSVA